MSGRQYLLRHRKCFRDGASDAVRAAAEVWACTMNAIVLRRAQLHPEFPVGPDSRDYSTTTTLSKDKRTITICVTGGPGTYGWLKHYEDEFPEHFYQWLPLYYLPDLELGRMDDEGWFERVRWSRLHQAEESHQMRHHHLFKWPDEP